jgi:hypothetical protein
MITVVNHFPSPRLTSETEDVHRICESKENISITFFK